MTDPTTLGFTTVALNDGTNARPCGDINLTSGSYDVKIEGFHAAGDVKELVTYLSLIHI